MINIPRPVEHTKYRLILKLRLIDSAYNDEEFFFELYCVISNTHNARKLTPYKHMYANSIFMSIFED